MSRAEIQPRLRRIGARIGPLARSLEFALAYVESDPHSSLTKSRTVLERIVLDLFHREMGREPRKPLLGDMLIDREFAARVDRRILSRMHAVRDMANLGPHGEHVDSSDASRVLADLIEILEWYVERYGPYAGEEAEGPPSSPSSNAGTARTPAPRRRGGAAGIVAVVVALVAAAAAVWVVRGGGEGAVGSPGTVPDAARQRPETASGGPAPDAPDVSSGPADAGPTSPDAADPGPVLGLLAPEDGAAFSAAPVALRWEDAAPGTGRRFEVEVVRVDRSGDPVGEPRRVEVPLDYVTWPWSGAAVPGSYRWRVRAVPEPGEGPAGPPWSAPRRFSLHASVLDRLADTGVLRVGMEMTFHRPFAWYDVENRRLTGFDVDLAAEIARRLGVEWEPVTFEWNELFRAVEEGKVDLAVSALTITDERRARVAFTRPYFSTGQRLTVLAGTDRDFGPDAPRFALGAQQGTSCEAAARTLPNADVRLYDTLDLALSALASREIDALVCDEVLSPAGGDPAYRFAGERLTSEDYGVMLRRGDPAFLERIDAIVGDLDASGRLAERRAAYGIPP
jgi:polar amino acid transport system substrate-binding protein